MKAYPILTKISLKSSLVYIMLISSIPSYQLFGQTAKGLDQFIEIKIQSNQDTLVEYEKVFATSPEYGREYFYAMPATPVNIAEIFDFTKHMLKLNGEDISNPDFNHNAKNEPWILDDGFKTMAEQTKNYYTIVRREWHLDIAKKEDWYVQLEVAFGHVLFRAGPRQD